MKQVIQTISVSLILFSCASEAQLFEVDNSKIGVNYKSSRGTIFNENYPFFNFLFSEVDSTTQWTPSKEDIDLAERILKSEIKEINDNKINQAGNCPVIDRNSYSYFWQYVGITNDDGQRIIHINFYWDKYGLIDRIMGNSDSRLDYNSNYAIVMDGCSYHWQVNVNLEDKELSGLSVNGYA
mgnify:CR=1 FL=1